MVWNGHSTMSHGPSRTNCASVPSSIHESTTFNTFRPAARTWNVDGDDRHHIINPATGLPVQRGGSQLELASVVAAHGAWAEVFTKALLVLGWDEGSALASRHSLAVFGVDGDGRHLASSSWETFAR